MMLKVEKCFKLLQDTHKTEKNIVFLLNYQYFMGLNVRQLRSNILQNGEGGYLQANLMAVKIYETTMNFHIFTKKNTLNYFLFA